MRVVVTGGAGFIGSHVVDRLLARGDVVLVVDDLSRGTRGQVPAGARLVVANVGHPAAAAAIAEFAPHGICHLAAQMDVGASVRDPVHDAQVNVLGTLQVLQAARLGGCSRLVLASSGGAIYGDAAQMPTDEAADCAPESPYGVSKRCGELYVAWAARAYGMQCTSLRLSNVYGPRQSPKGEAGVVAIFAEAMLRRRAPVIFGDGEQSRDFVYVDDVARAFVAALDADAASGALNVGSGHNTSLNQLVDILAEATGWRASARYAPAKPGEVRHSCLSHARATRLLGWRPEVALAEGLAATVRALRGAPPAHRRQAGEAPAARL